MGEIASIDVKLMFLRVSHSNMKAVSSIMRGISAGEIRHAEEPASIELPLDASRHEGSSPISMLLEDVERTFSAIFRLAPSMPLREWLFEYCVIGLGYGRWS